MFEDVCLVCGRIADGQSLTLTTSTLSSLPFAVCVLWCAYDDENRLYCSDACRDADAAQLPPSSIDHAIDLGFITDSIPPLVSSARPPRNLEDPSAVSSPTSSILTTPSVLDELDTENSDHHLTPATNGNHQKGHDPSTITGAATTMTSAGTTVLDSLLLPPTIQKAQPSPSSPVPPHFHLPHPQTQPQTQQQQQQQPQQQIRSPRLQPTAGAPLLPFARRPGNTNIHTPPPSTQPQHHSSHLHAHPNQSGSSSSSRVGGGGGSNHHHHHHHRRTASFNPASDVPPSAGVNPGGGAGTPGPILGGAGAGHASPFSPPSRGASGSTGPTTPGLLSVHHHHSSCSSHSHSRCSTSGHPSPALSPLRIADDYNNGTIDRAKLLANLEELDLDGARGDRRRRPVQAAPNHQPHHQHHAAQGQEDHDALEKARKRRARASLPAYFSNLVMGVAGVHTSSSKVPSTAVSSGTSSSDEQHKQQRQQQQRQQKIRHVRSKSAMRASDRSAAKLSTSASTFKVGGGVVGPTRSNSDGSVAERTSQAQSPTTPTVLTRNGSRNQLLAYFNSSVTTTSTMTKDGRENISPPPRGRDREKVRGRVRGINTSVGAVAMTPSVEAIVSPITATRHSMTPPGVLINHDGTTAGGVSPASFAEKHIRFIASSVANGSNLGSRRMLAALQGHLRSPPPPPASASLSGGKSGLSDQSPSSPIAIRAGSSSSGRPPLSAGILEESVEVPFVVPAGSNYTRAFAPRLHQRLGGGVGVGGRVNALTMSPKSRRYSSPTTSTAGIGAGLHVPIALMMSPAIERPAKPTAIPGANQDKETPSTATAVFGRGGRRNSRREEEMSPPRPVVRRGWSPVRGRGAAAVFDDDDDEEEEEEEDDEDEEKEENDDADEEEVEEEEEEEEEPQRGRSRSRMRSRSRARSRSLERRGGHRRSFGVAGY